MLAFQVCLPANVGQRTDTRSAGLAAGSRHGKDSLQEVAPGPVAAPHTDAASPRTGLATHGATL